MTDPPGRLSRAPGVIAVDADRGWIGLSVAATANPGVLELPEDFSEARWYRGPR